MGMLRPGSTKLEADNPFTVKCLSAGEFEAYAGLNARRGHYRSGLWTEECVVVLRAVELDGAALHPLPQPLGPRSVSGSGMTSSDLT